EILDWPETTRPAKVLRALVDLFRMQITALGDSALIVRVRDRFEDASEETLSEVLAALRRLENAQIPGVIELAPAYTTVGIFFDPLRVIDDGAEPDGVIVLIQRIG